MAARQAHDLRAATQLLVGLKCCHGDLPHADAADEGTRVDSLFWKEPCTIGWIAQFGRDDILLDIGANVGMYTIMAAAARGCRVVAFEPEAQSFALLNRNIFVNGLSDRVTAFCLGLSDVIELSVLHVSHFAAGMSNHSLGEDVDHRLRPRRSTTRRTSSARICRVRRAFL